MAYERILPFPKPDAFEYAELHALISVWHEKKGQMKEDDGAYKEFIKRLQREWAIETGIVERLYSWDRGVTEILIEQGIDSSIICHSGGVSREDAEHIQALINDHLAIVENLFGYIKKEAPLSEYFIRGLQAQFTAHQDYTEAVDGSGKSIKIAMIKGDYKKLPNNPCRPDGVMHTYCPPELVKDEMESLVRMYREAEPIYPSEVKSAWLHHRFTQIHPFQDGNGRVARTLASLVFLREGIFPLVVRDSDRKEYIGALEKADAGDLSLLISFFARRQKDAILKALGLEQQVQQSKHAEQIISSALDLLKSRLIKDKQKVPIVYEHADKLFDFVFEKFNELEKNFSDQLRHLTPLHVEQKYGTRVNSANNTSPNRHYFQKQIVETAKYFDYFANLTQHRSWVRITLKTDQEFDYVVSFHGYGPGESGILVASAFTCVKMSSKKERTEMGDSHPAAMELFQFNYIESYESTQKRFAEWLENSMVIALAEWKKSLG